MLTLNQVQHHIERRNSASTGNAAPIMDEQRFYSMHFWIALFEKLKHLPMHGRTIVGEQASFSQEKAAAIDRHEHLSVLRLVGEPS
jgi:hypothetical protein